MGSWLLEPPSLQFLSGCNFWATFVDKVSLILVLVTVLSALLIYLQAMMSLRLEEGLFGANTISAQDLAHRATGRGSLEELGQIAVTLV